MQSSSVEGVLVVPARELDILGRFQGFSPEADRYLATLLHSDQATFRPRALVEDDPSYKQIIPYVIFRSQGSVFCYTRGKSQGESRLHQLRSLGVGGHVDAADAEGRATLDAYEMALRRELDEEVRIEAKGSLRRVGLINDDSSPVGQVHLGVVYLHELDAPRVEPREDGLANAGFVPLETVLESRTQFETWSQICIDHVLNER
jgi:predicted NUDIX family phosphoesterase